MNIGLFQVNKLEIKPEEQKKKNKYACTVTMRDHTVWLFINLTCQETLSYQDRWNRSFSFGKLLAGEEKSNQSNASINKKRNKELWAYHNPIWIVMCLLNHQITWLSLLLFPENQIVFRCLSLIAKIYMCMSPRSTVL